MTDKPRILIAHTPAALAPEEEAGEELDRVSNDLIGGGAKRLSAEMLNELRASGWLRQARWRRGSYFTTRGLHEATGNPELVLLNVPGVFAPAAHRLLTEIGDYLLDSGVRLQAGEVFALTDPNFPPMSVTFDLIEPGDLQFPEFRHPRLIVVPLP